MRTLVVAAPSGRRGIEVDAQAIMGLRAVGGELAQQHFRSMAGEIRAVLAFYVDQPEDFLN